nr:hypothetical protein [Tanacetum cinerariifolium]
MAAKGQNHGKGKNKQAYAPKPKISPPPKRENPAKDSICHECEEIEHWKRNCPQSWIYDTGCGIHICNTTQGLRASRKLKPVALSLYVGNGQREAVEEIGTFYLCLPSGLEIVLNNCHYASSITRGVISISRLYEDGFVNRFMDNTIQVSKNNVVYFCVIPRDGIFEIDLSNSLTNESSIYAVSNKRAKLDLDSALLWHCRLGHISKKHIEKLQHDALLDSSYLTAFEKCVSCMSEKMARKPYTHQDYALETAARVLNMVPTKKVEKTPYKVWHGKAPKLSYLKVWGCEALVKRDTLTKPDKLEPRSIKCIFVGYPKETMGYSFYYRPENKVLVARNAEFLESSLIDQEASGSIEDLKIIQEEDTHPSLDTSLNHEEDDLEIDEPQSDIVPVRRSTRTRHAPDRMCLYIDAEEHKLGDLGEPANYKVALLDPYKWLFKKKTDMDGNVHIYKAHLVAKGYTQTLRIDYEVTFSPVADIRAIKILIAIAAYYDYEIWQMDVKTAFLNGYLNEKEKLKLSKSQGASTHAEMKRMQNVPYASAVGSIMYDVRCTRSDVTVSCYTDAGYLTDADDLKSQTGYVFVLNGGAVDWKSAKQSIFATSSAEAEYIAAFDDSKEAVWVRKFISRLRVVPTIEEPISMYCDNT